MNDLSDREQCVYDTIFKRIGMGSAVLAKDVITDLHLQGHFTGNPPDIKCQLVVTQNWPEADNKDDWTVILMETAGNQTSSVMMRSFGMFDDAAVKYAEKVSELTGYEMEVIKNAQA